MGGACWTNGVGEGRNLYRLLVGILESKRPLGRPGYRWVYNIKMNLGEIGWGGMYWINLVKNRDHWMTLENTIMNLQIP
jgi:hypothetical protein